MKKNELSIKDLLIAFQVVNILVKYVTLKEKSQKDYIAVYNAKMVKIFSIKNVLMNIKIN